MSFHLYRINEIYSNADGSVQFVELKVGPSNGESFWQGQSLTASQGGAVHRFVFPTNLPSTSTANTMVLVATQGFADLGLVQPDFVVPNGFLFTTNGSVDFAGVDSVGYAGLPTDGVLSIDRNLATAVNSPTDFAHQTGTIAPTVHAVVGTPGNDVLVGSPGPDAFDGGAGLDTAVLQGPRGAWTVDFAGGRLTGPAGPDTLAGIERLRFDDQSLAFDLDGSAGMTAKLLGAVFGPAAVHDRVDAGIGISLFDSGKTYVQVADLAIHAALGANPSNAALVRLLYTDVVGTAPDDATTAGFVAMIDSGQFTQDSLTTYAADYALNLEHVGLVGLASSGLEFQPVAGG